MKGKEKRVIISIAVSPALKAKIKKAAHKRELSVSAYFRKLFEESK